MVPPDSGEDPPVRSARDEDWNLTAAEDTLSDASEKKMSHAGRASRPDDKQLRP
jgi:hypothetical protein